MTIYLLLLQGLLLNGLAVLDFRNMSQVTLLLLCLISLLHLAVLFRDQPLLLLFILLSLNFCQFPCSPGSQLCLKVSQMAASLYRQLLFQGLCVMVMVVKETLHGCLLLFRALISNL